MGFWENTEKAPSVMDPLSKVWMKLENAKKSDSPTLSLYEISRTNHLFTWLKKKFNFLTSRYNILSSLYCPEETKNMLKNEVELLQTNDQNLFGKKFSDHLTELSKSKKNSKDVFVKP